MRPLLISDCDEVLLHMVKHFGVWLDERHDIDFAIQHGDFSTAMTRRDGGPPPSRDASSRSTRSTLAPVLAP